MASPKPSAAAPNHRPAPAPAPAADTAHRRQVPRFYEPFLFLPLLCGAAFRIALRLSRSRGAVGLTDVAVPELLLILVVLSLRWFHLSPAGSAARRWARFAVWVLSSSTTLGAAWVLAEPMDLPSAAVIWGIAAACVGFSIYLLLLPTQV